MKIEARPSLNFAEGTHLTVKDVGDLDFIPGGRMKAVELLWISTRVRRSGLSKLLIQSFVEQIGRGQKVIADGIIHPDSWLALERLGFLKKAYDSNKLLTLSDHDILNAIPITHVLQSGGLNVEKLRLCYFRKDFRYEEIRRSIFESPDSGPSFFKTRIFARS